MTVTHKFLVDHVTDGDTINGTVELPGAFGFSLSFKGRVRLVSVNAPEKGTPEGDAASQYVQGLISPGDTLTTSANRDVLDQYGRVLADVLLADGSSLSQKLLESGNAAPMTAKALADLAPHEGDGEVLPAHEIRSLLPNNGRK